MNPNEALFAEPTATLQALDAAIAARPQEPRHHLGMSQIGKKDSRTLWLNFRWCLLPDHDPRIERLFRLGDAIEREIARYLRQIPGVELHTHTPDGQQFRFNLIGGHSGGSMDGAICGIPEAPQTWHVWEAKSVSSKRFAQLEAAGVKAWSPEYYAQLQCYMGCSGMDRALFTAYNKDTSALYAERVQLDPLEWAGLQTQALRLIEATEPPASSYPSRDWFEAKWMSPAAAAIYWGDQLPPFANCRNCRFSEPLIEGSGAAWWCHRHHTEVTSAPVRHDCRQHQFLPALFPGELLQSDSESSQYRVGEMTLANGESAEFRSNELAQLSKVRFELVNDPDFLALREELGTTLHHISQPTDLTIPF